MSHPRHCRGGCGPCCTMPLGSSSVPRLTRCWGWRVRTGLVLGRSLGQEQAGTSAQGARECDSCAVAISRECVRGSETPPAPRLQNLLFPTGAKATFALLPHHVSLEKPVPSPSATSRALPPEVPQRLCPAPGPGLAVPVPARPRTRREPPRGWAAAAAAGGTAAAAPAGCAPAATSPRPRTCPRPSPGPGTGQQQEPVRKPGKKKIPGLSQPGRNSFPRSRDRDGGFSYAEGTSCSPVFLFQVLLDSPALSCLLPQSG